MEEPGYSDFPSIHSFKAYIQFDIKIKKIRDQIGEFDFENIEIKVNEVESLFERSYLLGNYFRAHKIPYETYSPSPQIIKGHNFSARVSSWYDGSFMNISVCGKIDFKILYLLITIAEGIFRDNVTIEFNFRNLDEGEKPSIVFGEFDDNYNSWTNVSRKIELKEITELNIENMDWEKLTKLFPIIHFTKDGKNNFYRSNRNFRNEQYENKRDWLSDALGGEEGAIWNID